MTFLRDSVNIGAANCPPRFEIRGTYIGKFISCYDGDTCDIVMLIPKGQIPHTSSLHEPHKEYAGYHLVRFRSRTMFFNAPEIKQPIGASDRTEQKQMAIQSRDMLWKLVTGLDKADQTRGHTRLVAIDAHGFDKYGRLLVEVFPLHVDDANKLVIDRSKSINKTMLSWLGPEYEMDTKGRMVHPTTAR